MEYDLFLWWDNKSARRGPLPTIPRANLLVAVNKGMNGGLVPSGPARHPKQSDLATWITWPGLLCKWSRDRVADSADMFHMLRVPTWGGFPDCVA